MSLLKEVFAVLVGLVGLFHLFQLGGRLERRAKNRHPLGVRRERAQDDPLNNVPIEPR